MATLKKIRNKAILIPLIPALGIGILADCLRKYLSVVHNAKKNLYMTKNILSVTLFLIITSSLLYGQDTTQLKRTPYKLKVAVDKKTVYEESLNETPYVLPDNTIQLYPGETLYIEIDQEDGIIKSLKAVKEIRDS